MTGDSRLVSVNPIRDTVFASNPELYYLIGNVLTISASMILTGGMAANAAVSAGISIGRAVVTEYAKQGLTMAASSYVEKSMTEATNSPLAGFVVGSLTGIATYGTLNEIDSMANVSGLHSSFAEGMSKEDAQKYLDFLENGSKEGLTEAEIRGIGKVDEALALKKVNPEELLELRKQQLGNVGVSGSTSNTGVGNPVKVEGRGSTGRTIPNNLEEQMAMHQVRSDPLEGATELPIKLNDTRWKSSDGWVKMQSVVKTADGNKITIHYVYNKVTGTFDDFKFK